MTTPESSEDEDAEVAYWRPIIAEHGRVSDALASLSKPELIAKIRTADAMYRSRGRKLDEALALIRDLRQFIPYEKPEKPHFPEWITAIRERVDRMLDA